MFEKWRVITFTRNMSDGETSFKEELDTEKKAWDKFYYNCNSYGTNPSTKACEVIIVNPNGDIIRIEKINNAKYIEPTPEVEEATE